MTIWGRAGHSARHDLLGLRLHLELQVWHKARDAGEERVLALHEPRHLLRRLRWGPAGHPQRTGGRGVQGFSERPGGVPRAGR